MIKKGGAHEVSPLHRQMHVLDFRVNAITAFQAAGWLVAIYAETHCGRGSDLTCRCTSLTRTHSCTGFSSERNQCVLDCGFSFPTRNNTMCVDQCAGWSVAIYAGIHCGRRSGLTCRCTSFTRTPSCARFSCESNHCGLDRVFSPTRNGISIFHLPFFVCSSMFRMSLLRFMITVVTPVEEIYYCTISGADMSMYLRILCTDTYIHRTFV